VEKLKIRIKSDFWRRFLREMTGANVHDQCHRDTLTVDAIARVLDGTEWSSDTLPVVADILRSAGRTVRDVDEAGELVYCKYCYKDVTPDDNGEQARCSECGAGLTPARM